jgi:membrane-bound serine protease (ClpP class)
MQALAENVWLLLTNPNVSFWLLVVGLWSVVFAITMPGTGVPETAAVVCLALAAVGLVQLPVTVVGLLLLGLAVVLYVLEFQAQAHGALLVSGAVVMVLGALFLFRTEARSEASLSWVSIVGAPLLSTLAFGFLIRQGLAAQRRPVLQNPDRIVGARGVTRTPVEREGTVYAGGEEWSATAETPIPPETEVIVLAREGLTLKVARAEPGEPASA